jgi:hypothetical protein
MTGSKTKTATPPEDSDNSRQSPFIQWGSVDNTDFTSWIESSSPIKISTEPTSIRKEIREIDEEKRAKQIDNDAKQQDIELKKKTLNRLFLLLCAETIVVFVFAYWQGRTDNNFSLDQWSFRIIISATILQITTMLIYAVRHLFPNNGDFKK